MGVSGVPQPWDARGTGRAEQRWPCGCELWLCAPVPLQRAMVLLWGGGLGPPAAQRKPLLLCARSETRAGEPQVRCGRAVGDGERQPALAGLLAVRGGDGVHHGGGGSCDRGGGTPGCAVGAAQPGSAERCLCVQEGARRLMVSFKVLYTVGYSLSLLTLVSALLVLTVFR